MIRLVRQLLVDIIDKIDAGNSNLSDEECLEVVESLRNFTIKDEGISKYSAYTYLNISRATFDNLISQGKLPPGKHVLGFKELRWYKKDLDEYVRRNK